MNQAPFRPAVSPLFSGGPQNVPQQFSCDADRVVQAGGALASRLVHPDVRPFSYTFRKAPDMGLYTATKRAPYQFVLGAYTVPPGQALAVAGVVYQPYRFDGVIAGEAVPLEDRRLPLSIGYDLTFASTSRQGVLQNETIPAAVSLNKAPSFPNFLSGAGAIAFPELPTRSTLGESTVQFRTAYGAAAAPIAQSAAQTGVQPQQFITAATAGNALLPQTQEPKQGTQDMPFTYYANEGEGVALWVVAFAPVRIPIAFFEGPLTGYLMPRTTLNALLDRMRPCG